MTTTIRSLEEYRAEYAKAAADPEAFWAGQASTFEWHAPWSKVLQWNFRDPDVKWFAGGKLNITENCLDRHLKERGEAIALVWEPNDPTGETRRFTYRELHRDVCRFANALKGQGVARGDRVCLYMPMVPELAVAVLACARIGAVHSVVFAGFSATSLADRILDADAKVVLCSDGMERGAKRIPVKPIVDEAVAKCPGVERVIVYTHTGEAVAMDADRDLTWSEALEGVADDCPAEVMDSEDLLFILYTSGSTGKPKGVVHTCGGYMVYAEYSFRNVFGYRDGDIYWCTADIGWITGHTYIVYGPLLAGATTMMFEGIPTWPDAGRFWAVCDKYNVNLFYTAPTAIRALMAQGLEYVEPYRLDSLRVLGTVGEPINEEAWQWYHDHIGKKRCWVVDTWWQTETGGILISPLADITPLKPTYATMPLPGIRPCLVDQEGNRVEGNDTEGLLCMEFPWPSILRTTYGDHERCRLTYFSTFENLYFTGDGARRDEDGNYRIIGRVDDVINVSGHRIGTAEVENAIDQHDLVVEAAVVGFPHEIKGQGIHAFVICPEWGDSGEALTQAIRDTVTREIGPIAKPDRVQRVSGLPKTRSGKIMRRILRKVAEGDVSNLGDTSTLLDPGVVEEIVAGAKS